MKKLILSLMSLILLTASSAFAQISSADSSSTVAVSGAPKQPYPANSDGTVPCECNTSAEPIVAARNYNTLLPEGTQAPQPGTGTVEGTD